MNLLKMVDGKWLVDGRKFHKFLKVKAGYSDFYRLRTPAFLPGDMTRETKTIALREGGTREVLTECYFEPKALFRLYHDLRIKAHKERLICAYELIQKEALKHGFRFDHGFDLPFPEQLTPPAEEVQSKQEQIELTISEPVISKQKDLPLAFIAPKDGFVDARKLHEFLEVKTKFADWIKRSLKDLNALGFKETIDYKSVSQIWENGGRTIEYSLSVNMGKSIAQMENSMKGQEVRNYFQVCEEKLNQTKTQDNYIPSSNMRMIKSIVAEIEQHGIELHSQGKEIQKLTSTVEKIKETTEQMVTEKVIHEVKSQFTNVIRSIEMPEGTKSLQMIQKQDLPGISEAKISLILSSYQHPQIKWIGEKSGQVFEMPLFFVEGLKQVVDRTFKETTYLKETPESYWFEHKGKRDRDGNTERTFLVKKDSAEKISFFFNWLQYHSDFSMDQNGNLIVPQSKILQLRS